MRIVSLESWGIRCLGKSANPPIVLDPKIVMDYQTFKPIVGVERVTKFGQFNEMQVDESFNKLWDMEVLSKNYTGR